MVTVDDIALAIDRLLRRASHLGRLYACRSKLSRTLAALDVHGRRRLFSAEQDQQAAEDEHLHAVDC